MSHFKLGFITAALFTVMTSFVFAKETPTPTETVDPTPTPTHVPKWIPAPKPRDDARNLSFDIYATYKDDTSGSNLFSIGDLYAKRKLDEYSVTTEFQVRFEKNVSVSDPHNRSTFV